MFNDDLTFGGYKRRFCCDNDVISLFKVSGPSWLMAVVATGRQTRFLYLSTYELCQRKTGAIINKLNAYKVGKDSTARNRWGEIRGERRGREVKVVTGKRGEQPLSPFWMICWPKNNFQVMENAGFSKVDQRRYDLPFDSSDNWVFKVIFLSLFSIWNFQASND